MPNSSHEEAECKSPTASTEDQDQEEKAINQFKNEAMDEDSVQHLDAECELMLRNTKKQVKQMMEEAVTRKFIHEESASMISLCVAVDACLSHKLKRRTLGLFKTNSSTALVQKIAKCCPQAQGIMQLVEDEEKRLLEEEQHQQQHQTQRKPSMTSNNNNKMEITTTNSVNSLTRQQQNHRKSSTADVIKHQNAVLNSNKNLHKRHLWLKCALMEKKLVDIVEFLADNAPKYYEQDALMSNYLASQLLCSLLVGPSALEFSRSKLNDYYQFEEPSADELLIRHKLSNPIACLCSTSSLATTHFTTPSPPPPSSENASINASAASDENNKPIETKSSSDLAEVADNSATNGLVRKESRRRPLALKTTNLTAGTLVTDCHHCSCKEISEHQHTRGYSFKSKSTTTTTTGVRSPNTTGHYHNSDQINPTTTNPLIFKQISPRPPPLATQTSNFNNYTQQQGSHQQETSIWSPRMLHETLHQNSRSSLLYAKNNVLLETQAHGLMAGYLSLHQTSCDLIIKWIPNKLINGGHQATSVPPVGRSAEAAPNTTTTCCLNGCNCKHNKSQIQQSSKLTNDSCSNQQQQQKQRSKSLNESSWCNSNDQNEQAIGRKHLNQCCCNVSDDCSDTKPTSDSQKPVGGSYLDLVVSLSVSRVVLLHCHFVSLKPSLTTTRPSKLISTKQGELKTNNTVETLILVETDGVQRAPFKFPKGGLRWFLSCLENGIHPDRYLELAIKPEGTCSDWPWADEDFYSLTTSRSPSMNDCSSDSFMGGEASSNNDQSQTTGGSRLDSLLRRLPSLKKPRKSFSGAMSEAAGSCSKTNDEGLKSKSTEQEKQEQSITNDNEEEKNEESITTSTSKVTTATTCDTEAQRAAPLLATLNYVYRICQTCPANNFYLSNNNKDNVNNNNSSIEQNSWTGATPPLSAFSVTSSSSGSFGGIVGGRWSRLLMSSSNHPPMTPQTTSGIFSSENNNNNSINRQSSEQNSSTSANTNNSSQGQRFRWSLSRLARFSGSSSRRSATNSSSSSIVGISGPLNSTMGGCCELETADEEQLAAPMRDFEAKSLDTTALNSILAGSSGGGGGDSARQRRGSSSSLTAINSASVSIGGSTTNIIKRDSSSELIRIEAKLSNLNSKSSSRDELMALRDHSLQTLCESMRKQILARAFYGWLAHCRRARIIREHLLKLLVQRASKNLEELDLIIDDRIKYDISLRHADWNKIKQDAQSRSIREREARRQVCRLVYLGGCEDNQLRQEVWPYLLTHYNYCDSDDIKSGKDKKAKESYEEHAREWGKIERIIKQRDNEILAANMARVERRKRQQQMMETKNELLPRRTSEAIVETHQVAAASTQLARRSSFGDNNWQDSATTEETPDEEDPPKQSDDKNSKKDAAEVARQQRKRQMQARRKRKPRLESTGSLGSDASITDQFGNNIHRIDKDVQRCDRQFWYFQETKNLDKLRNIMCSYVWQHLDVGYVQGMCDLAAPFLVVLDDQLEAFNCFQQLMKRMVSNFPHGQAMDQHFESLKYLMQVLDPKLFEVLQSNGDYTHFYFCYRWLLLDFKRELAYEDVFRVWETIWAARQLVSEHFVVFLALAMVRYYRDIIIENNMDFTDTIKFFNEMAERHDIVKIIHLAQNCVVELVNLIVQNQ